MENIMLLDHKRCALFVIDPQEKLMAAIHNAENVEETIALLVRAAKELAMPVIVTTQYKKGIGPVVPALSELLEGIEEIDKVEFDAFSNPDVRTKVANLPSSCDTLILTGVEAHICIHQTALSALARGYHVVICEDAISSRNKRHKKSAVESFRAMGMKVCPAETIVFELLKKAGTPEFKALLPFIK